MKNAVVILIVLGFFAVLFIFAYYISEIGKKLSRFDNKAKSIEKLLEQMPLNAESYNTILFEIKVLANYPMKDRAIVKELTQKLVDKFNPPKK